uniref:Uncharacterized protein n=1 Tax=Oryza sativa subsp. japonica TaxID=39947 RepID=Q6Z9F7_ORYSJ|nr:hypothetical protein [Oryza sativa Japonica Group]BAD09900.1 hypothetical protein [Oryza sativa Japonica Group]
MMPYNKKKHIYPCCTIAKQPPRQRHHGLDSTSPEVYLRGAKESQRALIDYGFTVAVFIVCLPMRSLAVLDGNFAHKEYENLGDGGIDL